MSDITPVEKLVYEEESRNIGGMIVLINGEPGSGKTTTLTRMVMIDMGIDNVGGKFKPENVRRTPFWIGQKSCQWILPAAQGIPVTLWIHESIDDFQFKTTGSRKAGIEPRKLDITDQEKLDAEIERFSNVSKLANEYKLDRLNVVYFPGSNGGEKEKYFYQYKNYELASELNSRDYKDHVTINADEIQNIAPDKNRRPFYDLQMEMFPTQWQDFRKNNISMRGTSHGYAEINWKFYDLKANSIIYMQGGRVHKNHTEIDQGSVNTMERGEAVVPAGEFEPATFNGPEDPANVFPWIANHEDVELEMEMEAEVPDVRPDEVNMEEWLDESPFEKKHLDEIIGVSEAEEEYLEWTSREIRRKLSKGKLPGIKCGGKWLLSVEQLINDQSIPIK
jgi:hypothetical protein